MDKKSMETISKNYFNNLKSNVVMPNTMTTRGKVEDLDLHISTIVQENIDGDFVECGTYRGGLAALMLGHIQFSNLEKKLYVYDTFEGMAEPTDKDISVKNEIALAEFQNTKNEITGYANWCRATIDIIHSTLNLVTKNWPEQVFLIKGKVEDTLTFEKNLPEKISLMRLDTDWYESTKIELETFYNKLSIGGVVIIDDYYYWQGQKLAVDEFFDKLDKDSYKFTDGDDGSLIITKLG